MGDDYFKGTNFAFWWLKYTICEIKLPRKSFSGDNREIKSPQRFFLGHRNKLYYTPFYRRGVFSFWSASECFYLFLISVLYYAYSMLEPVVTAMN